MILEYAPGYAPGVVPVGARWSQIKGDCVRPFMDSLYALEDTLLTHRSSHYGSLYFAKDVPPESRARTLYPDQGSETRDEPLDNELSSKHCIGPTAHRDWWRWGYCNVDA
ncbi:hypothetical protein BD413DRAFT_638057, partial [Trametes elegans]